MKLRNYTVLLLCMIALVLYCTWAIFDYSSDSIIQTPLQGKEEGSIAAIEKLLKDPAIDDTAIEHYWSQSSLHDTAVDRPVLFIRKGHLELNASILFYFEYFLSLKGELPDQILALLADNDFKSQYDPNIAKELKRLFHQYRLYNEALASKLKPSITLQSQSFYDTLEVVNHIKHDTQKAFFSPEEIHALFDQNDKLLNTPSIAEKHWLKKKHYDESVQSNPDFRLAIATELYGTEAANRLEKLATEKRIWKKRVHDYRLQKDGIMMSEGLDKVSKQQSIIELQERLFNNHEIKRIQHLIPH